MTNQIVEKICDLMRSGHSTTNSERESSRKAIDNISSDISKVLRRWFGADFVLSGYGTNLNVFYFLFDLKIPDAFRKEIGWSRVSVYLTQDIERSTDDMLYFGINLQGTKLTGSGKTKVKSFDSSEYAGFQISIDKNLTVYTKN